MSYDHVEDDDKSMICNVCPTTCAFEPTVSVTGANMSPDETESESEESDDCNDIDGPAHGAEDFTGW